MRKTEKQYGLTENDDIMKIHHDTQNDRNEALVLIDPFSCKSHLILVSEINESKFKIEIKQEISQQRQLKYVGKGSLLRSTEVNMKE